MTQLYKIANQYAELANSDDFTPEMIADTLDGMEGEFTDKCEQILAMVKNNKATAEALKAEAKNLTDRAKALLNKNENLHQYIISSMNTMEKKKLDAGIHTLTVRAATQKCVIDDVSTLPPEYVEMETSFKPLTNEIKAQLKAGHEINGAHLELGKQSLIVK